MSGVNDTMVVAVQVEHCRATCPHRESLANLNLAPSAPGDFHAVLIVDGVVWAHGGPHTEDDARTIAAAMQTDVDRLPGAKREFPL
jgi:hypothetical protein